MTTTAKAQPMSLEGMSPPWPITFDDVLQARERLSPYLTTTALRHYPLLDELIGGGTSLLIKHENHQPVGSFKVRNGLSFVTALTQDERKRGVVAASTGNHGQGVAYAASLLGVRATICVPVGNNPEKNAAMRSWGATVIEEGRDYDETLETMFRIARKEGMAMSHSTNDARVIAGAATMSLEMIEQSGGLDAIVIAVGGGSQSVGALTVARELAPGVQVFGAQAAGASAIHDSWHARKPLKTARVDTFRAGRNATRTAGRRSLGSASFAASSASFAVIDGFRKVKILAAVTEECLIQHA